MEAFLSWNERLAADRLGAEGARVATIGTATGLSRSTFRDDSSSKDAFWHSKGLRNLPPRQGAICQSPSLTVLGPAFSRPPEWHPRPVSRQHQRV